MTQWIGAITRGHNGGAVLLKDGEVVFAIEEERLSRKKYDCGPYASMIKFKEFTDKLDYLVVAHTQKLQETAGRVDYSGDDVYTGLIAQEIEQIMPECIVEGKFGTKTVSNDPITWALVNAVKELSAEVEQLKSQLNN